MHVCPYSVTLWVYVFYSVAVFLVSGELSKCSANHKKENISKNKTVILRLWCLLCIAEKESERQIILPLFPVPRNVGVLNKPHCTKAEM